MQQVEVVKINSLHTATVFSVFYAVFALIISMFTYAKIGPAALLIVPFGVTSCFVGVFTFCYMYNIYAKKMPRIKLTIQNN